MRDGLFALYPAVLNLGRRDLEAGVLVQALDVLHGAETIRERCGEPVEPREWSEGERLLAEVVRPVLRGSLEGIRDVILSLSNRQLRAILRDVRELAYVGSLGRRDDQ